LTENNFHINDKIYYTHKNTLYTKLTNLSEYSQNEHVGLKTLMSYTAKKRYTFTQYFRWSSPPFFK